MDKNLARLVFEKSPPYKWRKDVAMRGWVSPHGKKFIAERDVWRETTIHTCAICGDGPDRDIRHLAIDCFYDLSEVSSSFVLQDDKKLACYSMPICKGCRANFLFTHLVRFIDTKGRLAESGLGSDGIVELC